MTEKLDMFEVLRRIDKQDITFYDNLEPAQKKGFVPLLTMRWLSSGSKVQQQLLNTIVNPMVFKLHRHPALLYKLMVATSDGKSKRYSWIKKKGKDKNPTMSIEVIARYCDVSRKDAARYKSQFSSEDILDMAESLGYDKDQVKKLKTELK